MKSKVEDLQIDVLDLSPERVGTFDLVMFLGVLYHMRHPLLALERVFSVTSRQLILETHVDLLWCRQPAMTFYQGDELRKDPTNWWGPNPAAVEAMLRAVGFNKVKMVYQAGFLHRVKRAFDLKLREKEPFLKTIQRGKVVFHAWK